VPALPVRSFFISLGQYDKDRRQSTTFSPREQFLVKWMPSLGIIVTQILRVEAGMRRVLSVLASSSALIASVALAQTGATSEIKIAPEDCRRLVQHRASADVAYKPGVDARGNPVTPADLPGQARITAPNEITINLTIDVLQQYGVPADSLLAPSGEASIGTIKYDIGAGKLTYNGQSLSDAEQDALAAACSSVRTK
jgi:hypothetical protein